MKYQVQREEEAFEDFCRETVQASRADENVVNAAADSPFLFQRVRAQLAREATTPVKGNWLASLTVGGSLKWASAAAMAVLLVAAVLVRGARQSLPEPPAPAIAAITVEKPATNLVTPPASLPEKSGTLMPASAGSGTGRVQRRSAAKRAEEELTTEYVPLTYMAFADDTNSGHVVRVQMPRAALLTLGVSIGSELSAELVKADVIVGDDGLARAIRLVR